jgi:hypothetical protein
MSVGRAYRLAKTIDEQCSQLATIQPSMARITAKEQAEVSPIALHLGAQLYLAEKRVVPFNRLYRVGASPRTAVASKSRTCRRPERGCEAKRALGFQNRLALSIIVPMNMDNRHITHNKAITIKMSTSHIF